jgi:hypothetical protein
MLREAALGIAVVGPEGLASGALAAADVVVVSINAGLGLLVNSKRLYRDAQALACEYGSLAARCGAGTRRQRRSVFEKKLLADLICQFSSLLRANSQRATAHRQRRQLLVTVCDSGRQWCQWT